MNESNAFHIRSFVRLLNVSSQLYSFSCTQLKTCHLVLCSMFKTIIISFCVLSRWSTDHHVACTRPQPCSTSPSSPLNCPQYVQCMLWETTKNTRWWSFAQIVVEKCCGKFIITRKLVLYFKSSGKVKSKWPIGGWLWILFELIWLKIRVIIRIP